MPLSKEENKEIRSLLKHYQLSRNVFQNFLDTFAIKITGSGEIKDYIHSVKWRTKSPKSFIGKLKRRYEKLRDDGKPFDITKENLFLKINDLAGFRILYLHTTQFDKINEFLKKLFEDEKYELIEGPEARVWDDEYRKIYREKGIETKDSSENLYTSIHYIVNTKRNIEFTFEIQVRTLADELWGEVDHQLNYPLKTKNISCGEQLKVLARVTSSCTRLVDSIFKTYNSSKRKKAKKSSVNNPSPK
jgi:ppGpp synthetase/RelA/SpoT-type nucleotidyltranferase